MLLYFLEADASSREIYGRKSAGLIDWHIEEDNLYAWIYPCFWVSSPQAHGHKNWVHDFHFLWWLSNIIYNDSEKYSRRWLKSRCYWRLFSRKFWELKREFHHIIKSKSFVYLFSYLIFLNRYMRKEQSSLYMMIMIAKKELSGLSANVWDYGTLCFACKLGILAFARESTESALILPPTTY